MKSFTTVDMERKFKLFGGRVSDVNRAACKKLEKKRVMAISKIKRGRRNAACTESARVSVFLYFVDAGI